MRKVLGVLSAAVLAAAFAASAQAATVTATFAPAGYAPGNAQSGFYDGASYNGNGTVAGVYYFGVSSWNDAPTALTTAYPTGFYGACIDLTHEINWDTSHTWNVVDLSTYQAIGNPSDPNYGLYDLHGAFVNANQLNAIEFLSAWGVNNGVLTNKDSNETQDAATLQIALWHVIFPTAVLTVSDPVAYLNAVGDGNPSDGAYGATGLAGLAMAALPGAAGNVTTYALLNIPSDQTQDFSIALVTTGASSVPLPAAAWAGFSLLGGLGLVAKWRRRKNAAV